MVELINPNVYQVGEQLILLKYPNASDTIGKSNTTTITVELSSLDQSCDGKMFNIKPDDIAQHWKRSRS